MPTQIIKKSDQNKVIDFLVQNMFNGGELYNQLYKAVGRVTRDSNDKQDIIEDFLLNMLRGGGERYRGDVRDKCFLHWVHACFRREKINFIRKLRRRRDLISYFSELTTKSLYRLLNCTSREKLEIQSGYSDVLVEEEEKMMVRTFLSKLNDRNRAVVELFYFEDKSYGEIANLLNMPKNTVSTILYKVKKDIRKSFQGYFSN